MSPVRQILCVGGSGIIAQLAALDIADGDCETLTCGSGELTLEFVPRRSTIVIRLTPTQRAILRVASINEPHKAEWLASKLSKECNSYFRDMLTKLVRSGHLIRETGKYRLPEVGNQSA